MTRWITRLAGGSTPARPDSTPPDHRVVFARFAETLAARSPRVGLPRVREV